MKGSACIIKDTHESYAAVLEGKQAPMHCQERKQVLSRETLCLILRTCLPSQIQARAKIGLINTKRKAEYSNEISFSMNLCVEGKACHSS